MSKKKPLSILMEEFEARRKEEAIQIGRRLLDEFANEIDAQKALSLVRLGVVIKDTLGDIKPKDLKEYLNHKRDQKANYSVPKVEEKCGPKGQQNSSKIGQQNGFQNSNPPKHIGSYSTKPNDQFKGQ